ncbi:hypothetical protein F4U94_00075 [Sphingobium limneticum]|jgi:hypothetical protein|uniref:Uncharacterized protein n=1 Tax=Sphingobium limneticum TaxID=1007511 RepID=A0A5J5I949_9SPHN|nr:hypothetical protein [Sphingobium limneticum]KAA9020030.1 hypothetical protein F4U94_00075 [Sphingobium limneticum]KAA9021490.1 hypothetical protein F4U96_02020 [Sphingobium limneticum]KAA9033852.1 hypothetical protein F4U95_02020 [Sphingobium limneticum]
MSTSSRLSSIVAKESRLPWYIHIGEEKTARSMALKGAFLAPFMNGLSLTWNDRLADSDDD